MSHPSDRRSQRRNNVQFNSSSIGRSVPTPHSQVSSVSPLIPSLINQHANNILRNSFRGMDIIKSDNRRRNIDHTMTNVPPRDHQYAYASAAMAHQRVNQLTGLHYNQQPDNISNQLIHFILQPFALLSVNLTAPSITPSSVTDSSKSAPLNRQSASKHRKINDSQAATAAEKASDKVIKSYKNKNIYSDGRSSSCSSSSGSVANTKSFNCSLDGKLNRKSLSLSIGKDNNVSDLTSSSPSSPSSFTSAASFSRCVSSHTVECEVASSSSSTVSCNTLSTVPVNQLTSSSSSDIQLQLPRIIKPKKRRKKRCKKSTSDCPSVPVQCCTVGESHHQLYSSIVASSTHMSTRCLDKDNCSLVNNDIKCIVISHLRDKFNIAQPPPRPWISYNNGNLTPNVSTRHLSDITFTVMCYNVLCDKYATNNLYKYCPPWALDWEYRKKSILNEIITYSADIICLQEVSIEQFETFFSPHLLIENYHAIFSPKSRAKTMSSYESKYVDGCAIFFKRSKFTLQQQHLIEFNQLAMAAAGKSDEMVNRVMTKDNIGLAALLQVKSNGQQLLVATAHIHWDPEYCDVKLIQTMMLMNELKSIMDAVDGVDVPLILCGDFNSLPHSGVVEYLTKGRIFSNHIDFKQLAYSDVLSRVSSQRDSSNEFSHSFNLKSTYHGDILPYTNYTLDFKGVIDYIFVSSTITVDGALGSIDSKWINDNNILGFPHPHVPSDHFSLLVQLTLHSRCPISRNN